MRTWGGTSNDITLEDVKRRLPDLDLWQGVSGRYCSGRHGPLGPVLAEGEDPQDLLDMTLAAIAWETAERRARCEGASSG